MPYSSSLTEQEWVIERTNSWMERCKSLTKKIDADPAKCYRQD
ncbi:MAG: transposase [Trichodesmium sp. MAG_R04]|nr:transposase [Trichodesmium sp. MAG_R04]